MLPSRGLARNPASVLRPSLFTSAKPARTVWTRQFSHAQSQSSVLSRHSLLRTNTSLYGHRVPSIAVLGASSSVFAQRSASRNLSLWPFGSKSKTPETTETTETPAAPVEAEPLSTPAAAASETAASETAAPLAASSSPTSSLSSPVTLNDATITEIPDDLLGEIIPPPILDIPEHIGYLDELGLDFGWGTSTCCQWLLEHIHIYSGMPWWGSIAAVAFLFRAIIFYPALVGSYHQAKMQKAQASPAYLAAKARFAQSTRASDQAALLMARSEMRRAVSGSGASAWKASINIVMIPFSFGMFRLLRNMCLIPVPGLETGGAAWFTDLTVADPYYILPSLAVGCTYLVLKQTQLLNRANPAATEMTEKVSQFMLLIMPPVMFLTTIFLASSIQIFLLLMSLGSLLQIQVTLHPAVRRWMKLPPMPLGSRPTVINGTAREIVYEKPKSPANLAASFKEGIAATTKALKEVAGATPEKAEFDRAKKYEQRRAEEQKADFARRMEELRQRRQKQN
ncbi:hypothetical protein GGR50DRAFT_675475 [Xylaria sp. CBS 124048]|nr:hypothetical protein GGR50DRAFT_675475 [Xylaria sp. CBS 124048]